MSNAFTKSNCNPRSASDACVYGDKYRFTVLTSRLIRIEYSEDGIFEDRATQAVVNRLFPHADFVCEKKDGLLTVETDDIFLTYTLEPFSKNSLSVRYSGKNSKINAVWRFNDEQNAPPLPGTARTLDTIDGECPLEPGIMSKEAITVLDDGKSLIVDENGNISPRNKDCVDIYLFCYGVSDERHFDYLGCLHDYYRLTGKTPLIPRYALGNWWSRYYAYTQDEYEKLMLRFKAEEIPFSVAVMDMDWHYVSIDPKYGNGWTGYTWNKDLFPDHKAFLKFLHNEGLHVTLNLHPADGVSANEDAYEEMAQKMGIDPATEKRVEFDITNKKFLKNYFEVLHHPLEKEGVDFWWMDWQQGNTTHVPGLDPLWMLNHYHYKDMEGRGTRPMIFSRYSGPGSHRYPIGFSGDSVISWKSLDFQPYFTAAASNIGYGWWSHDIGGHMLGIRDEELTCRWMQYGVFSPINRLHSTESRFLGKEPWKYEKHYELAMKRFLRLRHELIPYLYSMNYRAAVHDEPLIMPMYYRYNGEECFAVKNEYTFGTEMIVSPITSPADNITHRGCAKTYLPEGMWYDFFTGLRYTGGRMINMYRDISSIPVLVKAGGIIPTARLTHINDTENPSSLCFKVYVGANNSFDMYEDDGISDEYKNGAYKITHTELISGDDTVFKISAEKGDFAPVESRAYTVEFIGLSEYGEISVISGERSLDFDIVKTAAGLSVRFDDTEEDITVVVKNTSTAEINRTDEMLQALLERASVYSPLKDKLYNKLTAPDMSTCKKLSFIEAEALDENLRSALIEIIAAEI